MIIGDVNIFAVEYEFTDGYIEKDHRHLFGKSRLYIQGKKFGNWDDENLLGVLVSQLKGLAKNGQDSPNLNRLSDEELKVAFEDRDHYPELGLSHAIYAENFDDYLTAYYKHDGILTFIWRFVEEPYNVYEDYSNEIHIGRVEETYFREVVEAFDKAWRIEWESIK